MRLYQIIRENVGLKIGAVTAATIFLLVILLVVFFNAIQVPLISKLSLIQILLVLAILISLTSILVVSLSTTFLVQRPLSRLVTSIRKAEAGDLKTRARVDSVDEIGQVAVQFNEMLSEITQLEINKLEADRQLTMAQEELRYQEMLKEKAEIISSTNKKLEESLKELSILYNISQAMTASIDPEELCNLLSDVLAKNIEFSDFAILLLNPETQMLEVKAARGFENNEQVLALTFSLGEGTSGHVVKGRHPIYIPDTATDPFYLHYKGAKTENGSFLSLPIFSKNVVLGVMNFSRVGKNAFMQGEIRMLSTIASQVGVSLENASLYARTKELSLIDDLTRVYNRRHFYTMLEMECKRARRFQRPLSLLMIDVDHFKRVNDNYGHLEGDQLLIELAATLVNNLREVDTLARYGGEEFAVVLPNTSLEDAEQVANKIRDLIEKTQFKRLKAKQVRITVSIGVASFAIGFESSEDLINHADIALYHAKAKGRNQVVVYREKTDRKLRVLDSNTL